MVRPTKTRHVSYVPDVTCYRPSGIPLTLLEEVRLSIEEIEAIRLKDGEGLKQSESARRMGVSRPTFQRVLAAAHRKIAQALIQGQSIRIEGGSFELAQQCFECKGGH